VKAWGKVPQALLCESRNNPSIAPRSSKVGNK
jgi:hypothetical protein